MNEALRQQVREYLLKQCAARHKKGKLRRIMDVVFGMPPDATYAFEYAECTADRVHVAGQVTQAWFISSDGVHEIKINLKDVSQEKRGMWYRFGRLSFYIAPNADWIVEASVEGPRAGHGGCFRTIQSGTTFVFEPEGSMWIS